MKYTRIKGFSFHVHVIDVDRQVGVKMVKTFQQKDSSTLIFATGLEFRKWENLICDAIFEWCWMPNSFSQACVSLCSREFEICFEKFFVWNVFVQMMMIIKHRMASPVLLCQQFAVLLAPIFSYRIFSSRKREGSVRFCSKNNCQTRIKETHWAVRKGFLLSIVSFISCPINVESLTCIKSEEWKRFLYPNVSFIRVSFIRVSFIRVRLY